MKVRIKYDGFLLGGSLFKLKSYYKLSTSVNSPFLGRVFEK
jgi:hypothetical protein